MENTAENVQTKIAEFTKTEAALATLETKYATVPDASTSDGYQACVEAIRELRPLRTGLDKLRLKLNADDQARIKFRNDEAKRITARLVALEDPIKSAKQAIDDEEERKAEEARQAEQQRIADIKERIQSIRRQAEGLLGADVSALTMRLDAVRTITVTEGLFGEFVEQAESVYCEVTTALESALKEREAFEAQQAEQARRQAELDRQAAEQRAREAAERERIDAERREAAETMRKAQEAAEAEQRRLQAEREAFEAEKRAEENKRIEAERAEAERVRKEKEALEQAAREREAAEQARIAAEAEEARQQALKPEKAKLRDWLAKLRFIDGVKLTDPELQAIQEDALLALDAVATDLIARVDAL